MSHTYLNRYDEGLATPSPALNTAKGDELFSQRMGGRRYASVAVRPLGERIARPATLFVTDAWQKLITGLLAISAYAVMAFIVWRNERRRVMEYEELTRPKLKCAYNSSLHGCIEDVDIERRRVPESFTQMTTTSSVTVSTAMTLMGPPGENALFFKRKPADPNSTVPATYHRLKVETDGASLVRNCNGRLDQITRDGEVIFASGPANLPFAIAERPDAFAKTVHDASAEFLDFLVITKSQQPLIAFYPDFIGPPGQKDWHTILKPPGEYRLKISVLSDARTISKEVIFKWTGDRATSEVLCP